MKTHLLWRVFALILSSGICACNGSQKERFSQPVEENIQLDSTILAVSIVADSLVVPWELVWGPDNWIWVSEERGHITKINPRTGDKKIVFRLPIGNRPEGAQAMLVHPDQKNFPYLYVHYKKIKEDSVRYNILERYTIEGDTLINPKVLLEFKAGRSHSGSRLAFYQNNSILWATGDQAKYDAPQDLASPDGKVLRLDLNGNIPTGNPFPNSYVYAYGFRNMQGMVVTPKDRIYTSEHGDATEDEINLIQIGRNYGFPIIEGKADNEIEIAFKNKHATVEPLISWTPTIAPAGMDYYDSDNIPEWKNSLLLTMLKGQGLRVLKLNDKGDTIVKEEMYLEKIFGRIRDICVSPEGDIYICTTNHDWNPMTSPSKRDDRILRISKVKKAVKNPLQANDLSQNVGATAGEVLYQQFCFSCHKGKGVGLKNIYPSLKNSQVILDKKRFLNLLLNGSKKGEYTMPNFRFLTDQQILEIVTYVRSSINNINDEITIQEIAKSR
ncbi:PQQ-dependent sugar dehydrogenase [Sphingobacterium hotanense]|uniref:PQQ-dependent sugar dehydrogenase n=1 Tax=Sphingobacterium hotanense TaxID=649196 RepID=A0ABT7NL15_9SPHI|nr:PQQ-dependent sugar dehydrogenase [Sphingobacterium hotanense]MDM1047895.1 PQQ-dependent sugar dehydrogenase [Sphingobacterium hotanense]